MGLCSRCGSLSIMAAREETDSSAESTQSVFERAVRHHLPSSFVTLLDRVDDFSIGKILVLHKKPHFWRRDELDFTSLDFEILLTEAQAEFSIQTERKKLYDQSSDASNRMVKLDLGLDAELKTRWADIGGDVKGGGTKLLNLYVDFGRIDHILSNLPQTLMSRQWTVNSGHTVMKDALAKGKEFFVITSVFEAQKAFVKIGETVQITATSGDHGDVGKGGSSTQPSTTTDSSSGKSVSENTKSDNDDINANTKGITITSRTDPTIIAFQVMKLTISADGKVTAHAKSGFEHHHKIHDAYGDTFQPINPSGNEDDEKKKTDPSPPKK